MRVPLLIAICLASSAAPAQADLDAIVEDARDADVVILGEVHDNPAHHAAQAGLMRRLAPAAVVFEMLDPAEAALITPARVADLAALEEALDWEASGWPDFAFYAPLFEIAARVPVHGAEVGRAEAQGAFADGAAAVFGPDAPRFGLDRALPAEEQMAREAEQLAAHCDALPDDILPGFVEAQRLRDAALAAAALEALQSSGPPVVIITGNGHARRDWGVPRVLALAAPGISVFSLGQIEGEATGDPPGDATGRAPFDAVLSAPPVDRPDPCAMFR